MFFRNCDFEKRCKNLMKDYNEKFAVESATMFPKNSI